MLRRCPLPLLVGALTLILAPRQAGAEPQYPRKIQSQLDLNYAPPCSICHQFGKTGDGTPIEPFAWSMRKRGLSADKETLAPALTSDEDDLVDSDGDGIPDAVELKNGTDPNSVANACIIPMRTVTTADQCTPGTQASPNLGCSLGAPGSAPRGRSSGGVLAMLGLFAVFRRRYRRAARGRTAAGDRTVETSRERALGGGVFALKRWRSLGAVSSA